RRARDATTAAAATHRRPRSLPRRRVDGHRLAGDDGERRPQRSARGACSALRPRARRTRACGGGRMSVTAEPRVGAARIALERGRDHLLSLQHPDGYWKGELETNVTIDAEDLFLRFFLGVLGPRETEATARWIRSKQREDGSWATFYGGPPDVSTTVEAYVGLRLAGDEPDADHMPRAAACVRAHGGLEATRVFTRMWLALLGLWSWHDVPVIPPEQILLPPRAPLSVYAFGCWARQTIVALSICCAL